MKAVSTLLIAALAGAALLLPAALAASAPDKTARHLWCMAVDRQQQHELRQAVGDHTLCAHA
jgi:hypothetical protein